MPGRRHTRALRPNKNMPGCRQGLLASYEKNLVYVIVIVRAVIPAATGINYRGIDRMYVGPTVCLFIIDAVGPMI